MVGDDKKIITPNIKFGIVATPNLVLSLDILLVGL